MDKEISNPEKINATDEIRALILRAFENNIMIKAVLSKPADKQIVRASLSPKYIGDSVLQLETFGSDNKARHENIKPKNTARLDVLISQYGSINLLTTAGNCEYRRSKSGNSIVLGGKKLSDAIGNVEIAPVRRIDKYDGNDRQKNYLLQGNEPFLRLLGVSDEGGRVHDKKQPKFRQINRFTELIHDIEKYLPQTGTLRICDLCCGKSYLSFAIYHYFAVIRKRDVRMTGVDLKQDVIEYCGDVAKKLGWEGLEFVYGDIGKYDAGEHVDLVVSLHACDTATDAVLAKAVAWDAGVIMSTPCCHHELNHTLNCPALDFIAKHSMLRQKFCDAATDAMRLSLLEANGYEVTALELIDPEETPKNILLRGIRKKNFDKNSPEAARLRAEYNRIHDFLVNPVQ